MESPPKKLGEFLSKNGPFFVLQPGMCLGGTEPRRQQHWHLRCNGEWQVEFDGTHKVSLPEPLCHTIRNRQGS